MLHVQQFRIAPKQGVHVVEFVKIKPSAHTEH